MSRKEIRTGVICQSWVDMPRGEPDFPYEGEIGDHEELGTVVSTKRCVGCSQCGRAGEVSSWLTEQKPS